MIELTIILLATALAIRSSIAAEKDLDDVPSKIAARIAKLWDDAQKGMKENRALRAEKALLTILKIDKKNAAAYNRLGILYAKQREYDNAIDCFEVASTIDRSASSLHNLGLIYYETEQYEKASIAFKQALDLEGQLAARHIAYAKVLERLGDNKKMIEELKTAVDLESNPETIGLLLKAYRRLGNDDEANKLEAKLKKLILPSGKPRRAIRPRRSLIN